MPELFNDEIIGKIYPTNAVNSTVTSEYIDMRLYDEIKVVFLIGNLDTTANLYIRESVNTSDSGGQPIPQHSVALTAANANSRVVLTVRPSDLTLSYKYIRARAIVAAGTAGNIAVMIITPSLQKQQVNDPTRVILNGGNNVSEVIR